MKNFRTKKIVLTAILAVLAVAGSTFSVPVMGSKCAPVQHLINIVSAVLLGPFFAVLQAFVASLIRNLLGLGTLFAFPGSMYGAFLAAILYRYKDKVYLALFGELFGTSILGGLTAYPIAVLIMNNHKAALFTFILPFFISTAGGTIIAAFILGSVYKIGVLDRLRKEFGGQWG